MEKKVFYELLNNNSQLKVFYSFLNEEWIEKNWYKLYQVNLEPGKVPNLEKYLKACITDGVSYIISSIKRELIPAGLLVELESPQAIKAKLLEKMLE